MHFLPKIYRKYIYFNLYSLTVNSVQRSSGYCITFLKLYVIKQRNKIKPVLIYERLSVTSRNMDE